MPKLYIITGSNGAGKSTVGRDYLPDYINQECKIFDGDKIFMEKQKELWSKGVTAHKEAKKLAIAFVTETFDNLVEESLSNKSNFVYEGHFTNEATWNIPRRFKASGFSIHMIFFGLKNTDLSELRVIARTKEGGHFVDRKTIESNFYGNLEKLNSNFRIFNELKLIDTSETQHKVLATFINGKAEDSLPVEYLPYWFINNLPNLTSQLIMKTGEL